MACPISTWIHVKDANDSSSTSSQAVASHSHGRHANHKTMAHQIHHLPKIWRSVLEAQTLPNRQRGTSYRDSPPSDQCRLSWRPPMSFPREPLCSLGHVWIPVWLLVLASVYHQIPRSYVEEWKTDCKANPVHKFGKHNAKLIIFWVRAETINRMKNFWVNRVNGR